MAGHRSRLGRDQRDVQGWSQAQSYQAHTALIGQLLNFQTLLSDAYGLTFDPEPQTYYLMTTAVSRLPFLIERLGRLRGSASAMLAKGAISDEQRTALIVITEEIRSATVEMERSMDKVIAQRPSCKYSSSGQSRRCASVARRSTGWCRAWCCAAISPAPHPRSSST